MIPSTCWLTALWRWSRTSLDPPNRFQGDVLFRSSKKMQKVEETKDSLEVILTRSCSEYLSCRWPKEVVLYQKTLNFKKQLQKVAKKWCPLFCLSSWFTCVDCFLNFGVGGRQGCLPTPRCPWQGGSLSFFNGVHPMLDESLMKYVQILCMKEAMNLPMIWFNPYKLFPIDYEEILLLQLILYC